MWDPVFQNLERKIASWKAKFLSFGARVTLLKSVLSSLPVYYLSLFKAPTKVISRLEQLQNQFLWAGNLDSEKIHWIEWNTVKTPKCRGGLGVQDLHVLNIALMSKWSWRFGTERNAWWRKLIVTKCGLGHFEWSPRWNLGPAGCSVWRWVVQFSSKFWQFGFIDPGGGSFCSFWCDIWVRGVRLCDAYPRIDAASQSLGCEVSDMCIFLDRWRWHIPLFVNLRGGALEELNHLYSRLEDLPPDTITAGPAGLVWPLEKSGSYTVRSMRRRLGDVKFPGASSFPSETVWVRFVPTKVQAFVWMAYHKKFATLDNLQKRGCILVNRCVLCCKCLESTNHLLLHCEFSATVWSMVRSSLSIFGPFSADVTEVIMAWKGMNCIHSFRGAVKVILHATFWCLWIERNNRIFRDMSTNPRQLFCKIMNYAGRWLFAADMLPIEKQDRWILALPTSSSIDQVC
ncbi:Putative ribonuclease H protein At1g65750 [Linum grandiflorum]